MQLGDRPKLGTYTPYTPLQILRTVHSRPQMFLTIIIEAEERPTKVRKLVHEADD